MTIATTRPRGGSTRRSPAADGAGRTAQVRTVVWRVATVTITGPRLRTGDHVVLDEPGVTHHARTFRVMHQHQSGPCPAQRSALTRYGSCPTRTVPGRACVTATTTAAGRPNAPARAAPTTTP